MTDRPLRVLYPFTGMTVGGSHVSTLDLVRGLPDRFTPVIACHAPGLLHDYLADLGMTALQAPQTRLPREKSVLSQIPAFLSCLGPLTRFLREHAIDIVHTNDYRMHLGWSLPARRAGVAQLWHQRVPGRRRRLSLYSRPARAVVTVSDWCRATLPAAMRRRTEVVMNPVSLSREPDRDAARARIAEAMERPVTGPVIGFLANFAARKAPEVFVGIAARIAARYPDAVFPMIGEARPPYDAELPRLIAAAGLQDRCALLGPRFPIEEWLPGYDVLLVPARHEGFGRTPVEAMLCGAVVVAADEAGHRESLTHGVTGLLVEPSDPAAYAEAVRSLLDEPGRRAALVRAACAEAETRFSRAAHVARITEIYDRIWQEVRP